MTTVSIRGVGSAAGRLRLSAADVATAWGRGGARGTTSVCAPDEDVLTLSWGAARDALAASDTHASTVDGLWWGTSRPPFAEGPSLAILAAAVGLERHAGGALLTGSAHAGVDALVAAAHAIGAGAATTALVVAADAVVPGTGTGAEHRAGAAAVAYVVGPAGTGPADISVVRSTTRPVVDRYRGDGEATTRDHYDSRLFREQILVPAAVEMAEAVHAGGSPRSWALPDPDGRIGRTVARAVGTTDVASGQLSALLGDTGAAAPLLGWLPAAGEDGRLGSVAWGGGRATGLAIDVHSPVPGAAVDHLLEGGTAVDYAGALRARGQLRPATEPVPMGVPPGSAMFVRETGDLLQLAGARCVDCGTIATPPAIHPTCPGCGGPKLERVGLARTGRVHTFVINHTMPAPFEAPLPLVVVDLDDGARLAVQAVGDGADLEVEAPVDLVLRRYAVERGVPVYGYKASVSRGGGSS